MTADNVFELIKADKYSQEGRDKIGSIMSEEVEDKVYNIGDISQKTGLMKTANGWVEPPNKGGKITPKGKELMERASKNPNLTEHGRAAASKLAKEYGKKLSGSNSENWKTDVVSKMETSKLEKMDKDFEEFKKSGQEVSPAAKERNDIVKAELAKRSEIAKQADFEKKVGDPAKEREQYWKEINEASQRPMPGVEELYNKTVGKESVGTGLKPGALEEMAKEVDSPEARQNYDDFMKAYKERERRETSDSAPRCLTGDCKIRIRK